jgi:aerobic carbon-monoxide dehydrogenase small subunit
MQNTITVTVNGSQETHRVQSNQTLLDFLRETLDLTGVKEGCNEGECGACVVLLDGKAINSCMTLAVEVDGHVVTTIEGIGNANNPHPLQQTFLKNQAVQCGFCTPGTILTALSLLAENPNPNEQDVREALAGNLCRCTGYRQIIDSVLEAATILQKGAAR